MAGLDLIGIVWSQTLLENYAMVNYIERYLRPLLKNAIGSDMFWGFEPYLVTHRPISRNFADASIFLLLLMTFLISLAIQLFGEFSRWDIVGIVINLILLAALLKQTRVAQKVRGEWSASDAKIWQELDQFVDTAKGS